MKTETPTIYEIRTLRDIFNLPTKEKMETCLRELSEAMLQARMVNDATVEALRGFGATDLERAFEWPEVSRWKDDDKGEVTTRYESPVEDLILTIKTSTKEASHD